MPDLFADDWAVRRNLVEQHVAAVCPRAASFDESAISRRARQLQSGGRQSTPGPIRASSDSLGSARASSFALIPGHEVIDTQIRVLGVTRVASHCVFLLHVDSGKEQFVLQKRYSQFRALRQSLLQATATTNGPKQRQCRNGACLQLAQQIAAVKFPRRKLKLKLHRDDDVRTARDRSTQLQSFVEAILRAYRLAPKRQVRCCVNSQCRVLGDIRAFLDIKDLAEVGGADWKSRSYGSGSGSPDGSIPMLDTPPSTSSAASLSEEGSTFNSGGDAAQRRGPRDFPPPTRVSAKGASDLGLEQLYTITEDLEHLHHHP
ncbi:hypothetical protein BBJ28_00007365 [Nothophytophthora sp. Chile5]|nr:hypothetical protein BBJ28_00007365 [Nothophytophthora sp. Chile5]